MPAVNEQVDRDAEPVRVLIVDDQAPFREAAKAVIARIAGFELAAEATSGEEAVDLVDALHPSLVLMDINMGEMDGLEATRLITAAHPETLVFLVSTYTVADMPPGAHTCGAAAYLNKDEVNRRMVRALWDTRGDPAWRTPAG
jgi:DNA-binding NarL/FixJ family response regulator